MRISSDFDDVDFKIPNSQSAQMKFSLAINQRKIVIDDVIDENTALECVYFLNKLEDIDKKFNTKEPIEIYINSVGGSAYECFLVIDKIEQMKNNGYTIITINMAKAFSAGMAIALCGSIRKSFKRARYMFHDVASGSYGKSQELIEHLDEMKIIKNTYYDIIKEYTNISDNQMNEWQEKKLDKFFSSEEMYELKGVDCIL